MAESFRELTRNQEKVFRFGGWWWCKDNIDGVIYGPYNKRGTAVSVMINCMVRHAIKRISA